MFFYTVLLVACIYLLSGWRIAREFHGEILSKKSWMEWVPGMFMPLIFFVELLVYPGLLSAVHEERDRKIELRLRADEARTRRLAEEKAKEESNAALRAQWFAEHPPVLYYTTMSGITAVVTPHDYQCALLRTRKAIRNGMWEDETLLLPIENTYLFVTKQGADRIQLTLNLPPENSKYVYCGFLSDLDDLVEKHSVHLKRKDDIFVPFVNETILPFGFHKSKYVNRKEYDSCLIEAQAPQEIR